MGIRYETDGRAWISGTDLDKFLNGAHAFNERKKQRKEHLERAQETTIVTADEIVKTKAHKKRVAAYARPRTAVRARSTSRGSRGKKKS